jgi:ClpP class serine protease
LPTWGEILEELKSEDNRTPAGPPDFDKVRRRYLARLSATTGRATILYASAFLDHPDLPAAAMMMELGDKQGFMNAVAGLAADEVDLIVTSPGGSAEATEAILKYLRTKFRSIRVIVPVAAMSAATMLALGADTIVLGSHSQLGPIDPQFSIATPEGPRFAPLPRSCGSSTERLKIARRIPRNWWPGHRSFAHTHPGSSHSVSPPSSYRKRW